MSLKFLKSYAQSRLEWIFPYAYKKGAFFFTRYCSFDFVIAWSYVFPVNWYVSNISRVPVPAKCNSEFLFCTLFVKLMLLYNKQSIFFSIYSTISKSYLDPLMDRNWELLVTELVQHLSFLGAPLFFEQSIFINLVDCSLNFPLTHRQFVVSYLRLI